MKYFGETALLIAVGLSGYGSTAIASCGSPVECYEQALAKLQETQDALEAKIEIIEDNEKRITAMESLLKEFDAQSGTIDIVAAGTRALRDGSQCLAGSAGVRGQLNGREVFPQPFNDPPSVSVALQGADVVGTYRLWIEITSTDRKGFDYKFYTYCDTEIYSARASWLATTR